MKIAREILKRTIQIPFIENLFSWPCPAGHTMTAMLRSACGMRRPAEVSQKDGFAVQFLRTCYGCSTYPALFAICDFKSTVSIARDNMPPEMVRALNPFCKRMRVA